jgi:hypothetical protein
MPDPVLGIFTLDVNVEGWAVGGGTKIFTMPESFPEPEVACNYNFVDDLLVCATGRSQLSELKGSWFATYKRSNGAFVRSYTPVGLPPDMTISVMQVSVVGYTGIQDFEYVMYNRVR